MIYESDIKNIPEQYRQLFASMQASIIHLTTVNNKLRRMLFGPSSEKHLVLPHIYPVGTLFNEPESILDSEKNEPEKTPSEGTPSDKNPHNDKPKKTSTRSPDSGGRNKFPEDLPRIEIICDLSEAEKICPQDGTVLVEIGRDVVEKIDVKPAEVFVNQYVYIKYGKSGGETPPVKASAVPSVIPGASCDSGMLSFILEQKYLNAMPLYRLEENFSQMNVDISRTSMARWAIQTADFLGDLAFEIKNYILSQKSLHADETTIQVLHEPGKKAQTKSYMWMICSPENTHPAVWFQYESGRAGVYAKSLLEDFSGLVHTDGYDGYNKAISKNKATRLGCWAHVRRKFVTAKKVGIKGSGATKYKTLAEKFLELIQSLFKNEAEFKAGNFEKSEEHLVIYRKTHSKPIIDQIKTLLDDARIRIPTKNDLGDALTYLHNEWTYLIRFLDHGAASLSNNRIENHVRPFAIGRKNWLFADTTKGADASAILYTVIATAKANGLSVRAYLKKIFSELPALYASQKSKIDFTPFLPWNCTDCLKPQQK
jgi:transposase